jgi:hypothetical protein
MSTWRCGWICPRSYFFAVVWSSLKTAATPSPPKERRRSTRDLVLAVLAVSGGQQLAVGGFKILRCEPAVFNLQHLWALMGFFERQIAVLRAIVCNRYQPCSTSMRVQRSTPPEC